MRRPAVFVVLVVGGAFWVNNSAVAQCGPKPEVHLDAGTAWEVSSGPDTTTDVVVLGGGLTIGPRLAGAFQDEAHTGLQFQLGLNAYHLRARNLGTDERSAYWAEFLFGMRYRPRFEMKLSKKDLAPALRPTVSAMGGMITGSAHPFTYAGEVSGGIIFERFGEMRFTDGTRGYVPVFSVEAVYKLLPLSEGSGNGFANVDGGFLLRVTLYPYAI